jgi:surfeit locus 1 family protein
VPSYRFALRPRWILSHLFVLLLVLTMVNLGFWQLRRLDERKDFNHAVRTNAAAEAVPVTTLLPTNATSADVRDAEWRRVTVSGTYRADADVLVANRVLEGQPGYWIVTPITTADSGVIAVVRGFVTRALVASGGLAPTAPPGGTVTVTGFVQRPRHGGRFASDREAGLAQISTVDVDALAARWGSALAPYWLQLTEQAPAVADEVLQPVPRPTLDNGPHLSYAIQWFTFSMIAVIGYPLILRRNARARALDGAGNAVGTGEGLG